VNKRAFYFLVLILVYWPATSVQAGIFTIPDWLQKSCVFIMKDSNEAMGTGFLVWLKDQEFKFCYLVTAKHVIVPVLSDPNVLLLLRFNLKEKGKARIITFPTYTFSGLRWLQHKNPSIDIAAIPLTIFDQIQVLEIGGHMVEDVNSDFWATSNWLKKYNVGIGDQVFTLGLVPYLYSSDQVNLVLSRFGNISLLLQEEIYLPGGRQKAYFLDCQAFGGNSGGPAFVLIERSESGGATLGGWRFALLGVVTEFVPSPLRTVEVNSQEANQKKGIQLIENTGISKVVPVDYLMDILFSEQQKTFREDLIKTARKNPPPN